MLRSGTSLSHFQIVDHIGGGGMGEVYSAIDCDLDRRVAIKVLPAEATRDPSRITRFMQEAKAASALNHPNIVTVYEIGRAGDEHFIAMELVDGETLRDRFARGGDARSLIPVFAQIADGLEKAHNAGIVHRDLKPENVMITSDGYAKILDFGLAKLAQAGMSNPDAQTTEQHLTREGTVVGTMGYMSPEQLRGERVDHRTDVFALGCMLYEAFTGAQPFRGASQVDTIHNVLHEMPPPIRDAAIQRITAKALAKRPDERYQSARELAVDLRDAVSQSSPSGQPPRLTRFAMTAVVTVVVIAAVVVGAWRIARPAAAHGGATAWEQMSIVPVAGTASAASVALAPDGKYLAYTRDGRDGSSLMIRQVVAGSESQIIRPHGTSIAAPTFSPDGDYIYYNEDNALFQIPVLGGTPRKIIGQASRSSFAPDAKRLCFSWRGTVFTAAVDGSDVHRIAGATSKESFHSPVWGRNPNIIAAVRRSLQGAIHERIQVLHLDVPDPVAAASTGDMLRGTWSGIDSMVWAPDDAEVIVSGYLSFTGPRQLLKVPVNGAEVQRITNDLSRYSSVSLSGDGKTLAAVQTDARWEIVQYSLRDSHVIRQIAEGPGEFAHLSMAPDGAVVYNVFSGNNLDLWISSPAGQKKLTDTKADHYIPQFSPDGQSIAYISDDNDRRAVWVIGRDGAGARQLTNGRFENSPRWSHDGKWIYFTSRDTGKGRLMKVPAAGGTPTVIETPYASRPSPSPDGKTIAAVDSSWVLAFLDAATGRTIRKTSIIVDGQMRWTADGRGLLFTRTDKASTNLWRMEVSTGALRQLTHIDTADLGSFDCAPDEQSMVAVRSTKASRIVLIRGFR